MSVPGRARLVFRVPGQCIRRMLANLPPERREAGEMSIPETGIMGAPACAMRQILLAEDNPADVALVRMALQDAGIPCELRVLADGQKAVAFIQNLDGNPLTMPVDLILLDIHLPKRDGEEILKCLRSTERYSETPVILLTGSDILRDVQAQTHAATRYFRKPSTLAGYMELGIIARDILIPRKPAQRKDSGYVQKDLKQ